MRVFNLSLKRSTSRGRDTYGWNIVRLVDDNNRDDKTPSTCGGGYDMVGAVLGYWIERHLGPELRQLDRPFTGLKFIDPDVHGDGRYSEVSTPQHVKPSIDGSCGEECMIIILEACGFEVRPRQRSGYRDGYAFIELTRPEPPPPAPPMPVLVLPIPRSKPKIIRNLRGMNHGKEIQDVTSADAST